MSCGQSSGCLAWHLPTADDVPLTPQDCQIIWLVASGHTTQAIAHKLWLTANTIKTHLHRIYDVLDVVSQAQLVAEAFRLGILTWE